MEEIKAKKYKWRREHLRVRDQGQSICLNCIDIILEEGSKSCINDNNLANEIHDSKPDGVSIITATNSTAKKF